MTIIKNYPPPAPTAGDTMTKSVYDVTNDGKVDLAAVAEATPWTGVSGKPASFPPTTHAHAPGDVTGTAVVTADNRLSDARAPLTHAHAAGDVTGTAVVTADSRLSDARVSTIHDNTKHSAAYIVQANAVVPNTAITPGTNTKITYDAKGLITAGAAANAADVGLGSVNNTTDAGKPVSTAQQTALDLKANLISPTFTGTPAAPAPAAGTNTTQLATTAYAMAAAPNASYRMILDATGSHIATKIAGTYLLGQGSALMVSGTGTLTPVNLIAIVAADYPTVNGLAPKLRIRAIVAVNAAAPTGNFTIGLYPITSGAGGAGLKIYTVGSVVASTSTITTPGANSMTSVVSADFALPADGVYALAVLTTATIATSSLVHVSAMLQIRNA